MATDSVTAPKTETTERGEGRRESAGDGAATARVALATEAFGQGAGQSIVRMADAGRGASDGTIARVGLASAESLLGKGGAPFKPANEEALKGASEDLQTLLGPRTPTGGTPEQLKSVMERARNAAGDDAAKFRSDFVRGTDLSGSGAGLFLRNGKAGSVEIFDREGGLDGRGTTGLSVSFSKGADGRYQAHLSAVDSRTGLRTNDTPEQVMNRWAHHPPTR